MLRATGNNRFFALILIAIIALIIDTSITKTSAFTTSQAISQWRIVVFGILAGIFGMTQFFILQYVHSKNTEARLDEPSRFRLMYKVAKGTQYILVVILSITLFQMVYYSNYNLGSLIATMTISYALAISTLALLIERFLSWYKSNQNSVVVLLYGLSSIALAINLFIALAFAIVMLQDKTLTVLPHPGIFLPPVPQGSLKDVLSQGYLASSIISFMITWIATALLLRHYSRKLGKTAYWGVMSIPLVYFLSQFLTLMHLFDPFISMNPILNSLLLVLIFSLSKPIGGIMFGLAFWIIGKNVGNNIVRYYMTIAGAGLLLLFISNQAVPLATSLPYPPFGLATVSFTGLSSFLMLVGVYSSATSLSQDIRLRTSIRKFSADQLRLLDSIGSAEMEQKIKTKVIGMIKQDQSEMADQTGVQSSLTEENMQNYMDEVLRELRKGKEKNKPQP